MLVPQAANFLTYGVAAGAMVTTGTPLVIPTLNATAKANSVVNASGSVPLARATRLVNSPLVTTGSGSVAQALPKANARVAALIQVNTLSQDAVTGAVLEAPVEGSISLKEALRLLLAVAVGKTTISGSTVTFRDLADTKARITASMTGSERTTITRDAT
jgi:hypothetical protein